MKSSVVVALGGAVVALGCAALLTQVAGGDPARQLSGASAAPPGETAASARSAPGPSGDSGQTPTLRRRAAEPALEAQDAGPAQEDAATARELTRAEQIAADQELHAAYIAQVEDAFEREPPDPAWSASTTARVWDTVRSLDFMRDATRSVECRSRACRIELDDDESAGLHKNLPVFAMQFADILPAMTGEPVTGPDGRKRMVLYLMQADPRSPVATSE